MSQSPHRLWILVPHAWADARYAPSPVPHSCHGCASYVPHASVPVLRLLRYGRNAWVCHRLLPPKAEYHVRPRHPDSFRPPAVPPTMQDRRSTDVRYRQGFYVRIRLGEDVFGHPSPIKTTLRVHRIRPEMFHDSLQAHASGFHDFSGEHIIIDKRRVQFTQMRSDGAFAGGDASGQPNSNHHNRHCNV